MATAIRSCIFTFPILFWGFFTFSNSQSLSISLLNKSEKIHSQLDTLKNTLPGDNEFEELDSMRIQLDRNFSNSVAFYVEKETMNRKYREKGLELWYKYPQNPKKFDWLRTTITVPIFPLYWLNVGDGAFQRRHYKGIPTIEVDNEQIRQWDNIYPKLKNELLNSPLVTQSEKISFKRNELTHYIMTRMNSYYRNGEKLNLEKVEDYFLASAKDYWNDSSGVDRFSVIGEDPIKIINMIFSNRTEFGIDSVDLSRFVEGVMQNADSKIMKEWALAKKRYLALYSNPLELSFSTLDGNQVSLSQLRGKVVLIDFWATWCRSCISFMPKLKTLHEKYRSKGFEVISVSVDSEEKIEKVRDVERKINGNWPTILIGGKREKDRNINSQYREIWDKYAFYTDAVPVVFVLNRKGLLVAEAGDFQSPDFESKLLILLETDKYK